MSPMTPELARRVWTGLGGAAALLVLLIWGGSIGIYFITLVLALGTMLEYAQLSLRLPDQLEKRYFLLFLTWVIVTLNFGLGGAEVGLAFFAFISLFMYFLFTAD